MQRYDFFFVLPNFFRIFAKNIQSTMRKIIFTICLVSLISTALRAEITRMDGNSLSFGVGFGWLHKEARGDGASNFPSVSVRYERGIHLFDNVGVLTVGGLFGFHYSHYNGRFPNTPALQEFRQSWTSFYIMPKAKMYFHEYFYHLWGLHRNIELYAGVGLGVRFIYNNISDSHGILPPTVDLPEARSPRFGWNVFLGARYAINTDFAVFAEFGWGLSIFTLGATIAF